MKSNRTAGWLISLSFFAIWTIGMTEAAEVTHCTSTREFITALEFLRQEKAFSVPEPEARKIATQVSAGCTGAAGRFIRVSKVLGAAGLGGPDAVRLGVILAHKTERETETFVSVFQTSFLEDALDLDLAAALHLAKQLSLEFEGDVLAVRDDFETLVDWCLKPTRAKGLELARPRCASFAVDLARKGQNYSGGVARPFIQAYTFLKSEAGPALTTEAALKLASELITRGPDAPENFSMGYKYAISKKGLDLPRNEAIAFGRAMAYQTPAQNEPGWNSSTPQPATLRPNRTLSSVPQN